MRILLLTQVVPNPPDSGPKIKTHNLLRYLAQRHEVHLLSFARSDAEERNAKGLSEMCSGIRTIPLHRSGIRDVGYLARSLVSGRPFLVERDDMQAMRGAVAKLISRFKFDAVHADQLTMAQFAVDLPVPLRVLDEHNAVWTIVRRAAGQGPWGVRRAFAEIEWRKLRLYEGVVVRQFDCVTVVSDADRIALEQAAGGEFESTTIPIAVDTQSIPFVPRTSAAQHVVSIATMFYPPNVEGILWFGDYIFPRVKAALPQTLFEVVGSRPPRSVAEMAARQPGVLVRGYVAELEPILRKSAVMVVPLKSASGMRVKILEAFARGIPVVSTTIGVEGIAAVPGRHLLVADDPIAFGQAVIQLLREPDTAMRLARAARELVEARYDWRTALGGLDGIYTQPGAPLPGMRPATLQSGDAP